MENNLVLSSKNVRFRKSRSLAKVKNNEIKFHRNQKVRCFSSISNLGKLNHHQMKNMMLPTNQSEVKPFLMPKMPLWFWQIYQCKMIFGFSNTSGRKLLCRKMALKYVFLGERFGSGFCQNMKSSISKKRKKSRNFQ